LELPLGEQGRQIVLVIIWELELGGVNKHRRKQAVWRQAEEKTVTGNPGIKASDYGTMRDFFAASKLKASLRTCRICKA
jgi:hypothetical protein